MTANPASCLVGAVPVR